MPVFIITDGTLPNIKYLSSILYVFLIIPSYDTPNDSPVASKQTGTPETLQLKEHSTENFSVYTENISAHKTNLIFYTNYADFPILLVNPVRDAIRIAQ